MSFEIGLAVHYLGLYLCAQFVIGDWMIESSLGWSWDDMCLARLRLLDRGSSVWGYVYLLEIALLGLSLHVGYLEPSSETCDGCDGRDSCDGKDCQ